VAYALTAWWTLPLSAFNLSDLTGPIFATLAAGRFFDTYANGLRDEDHKAAAPPGSSTAGAPPAAPAMGLEPDTAASYIRALWHALHSLNAASDMPSPFIINGYRYAPRPSDPGDASVLVRCAP
jgi:hypothetical protein